MSWTGEAESHKKISGNQSIPINCAFSQPALKTLPKTSRKWCSVMAIESSSKDLGLWQDPRELERSSFLTDKGLGWERKGQENELAMRWSWHMSRSRDLSLHLFLPFYLPPSFAFLSTLLSHFPQIFYFHVICVHNQTFKDYSRDISET